MNNTVEHAIHDRQKHWNLCCLIGSNLVSLEAVAQLKLPGGHCDQFE